MIPLTCVFAGIRGKFLRLIIVLLEITCAAVLEELIIPLIAAKVVVLAEDDGLYIPFMLLLEILLRPPVAKIPYAVAE
jgi:hypothetical protein